MSLRIYQSGLACDEYVCGKSKRLRLWLGGGRLRRRMIRAMIHRMQNDDDARRAARRGTDEQQATLRAELATLCRDEVGNPFVLLLVQLLVPLLVRLFLEWWLDDVDD